MINLAENQIPSEAHIAFCAHLIWEVEGRPDGLEKSHWSQAEDQLFACHAHEHWMSSKT